MPGLIPLACPHLFCSLLTVATSVLLLVQLTMLVTCWLVPSDNTAVAVKGITNPAAVMVAAGVTCNAVTVAALTVN
ncbi:hypothetical protein D3C79_986620 [compost metagenome]